MTEERKHTPLPWFGVIPTYSGKRRMMCLEISNNDGIVNDNFDEDEAFILRACNAHYEIVEALQGLLNEMNGYGDKELESKAIAALKLANGG